MTYTYQVTEVHLLKNSLRTVAARTALLDRVPSGATTLLHSDTLGNAKQAPSAYTLSGGGGGGIVASSGARTRTLAVCIPGMWALVVSSGSGPLISSTLRKAHACEVSDGAPVPK